MTLSEEEIQAAKEGLTSDLERLGELDDGQVDYLRRLSELEDDELELEHDEEPKLTDEEWQYVLDLSDG